MRWHTQESEAEASRGLYSVCVCCMLSHTLTYGMCTGERGGGGAWAVQRMHMLYAISYADVWHTQESEAEAARGLYVGPVESNIHMAKQVLLYK